MLVPFEKKKKKKPYTVYKQNATNYYMSWKVWTSWTYSSQYGIPACSPSQLRPRSAQRLMQINIVTLSIATSQTAVKQHEQIKYTHTHTHTFQVVKSSTWGQGKWTESLFPLVPLKRKTTWSPIFFQINPGLSADFVSCFICLSTHLSDLGRRGVRWHRKRLLPTSNSYKIKTSNNCGMISLYLVNGSQASII